jgi:hypothetical protein
MSKPNKAHRERKNVKFTQKHPELPKGRGGKFASRKEWAKVKKLKKLSNHQ